MNPMVHMTWTNRWSLKRALKEPVLNSNETGGEITTFKYIHIGWKILHNVDMIGSEGTDSKYPNKE